MVQGQGAGIRLLLRGSNILQYGRERATLAGSERIGGPQRVFSIPSVIAVGSDTNRVMRNTTNSFGKPLIKPLRLDVKQLKRD